MHTLAASAGVTDTAQKFCKRTAHHLLVLLQLLRYVNQCASSALQRLHYSFLCALPRGFREGGTPRRALACRGISDLGCAQGRVCMEHCKSVLLHGHQQHLRVRLEVGAGKGECRAMPFHSGQHNLLVIVEATGAFSRSTFIYTRKIVRARTARRPSILLLFINL
jgi:hypothetical protein